MATGKKKFSVKFDGFAEMAEQYDRLGGDLKKAVGKCLDFIPEEINPKLQAAMAKHHRSGRTELSIVHDQSVEWDGTVGSISVGFDIAHGGLPSIFLMYGTARHTPVNKYGTPRRAGAKMNPGMDADKKLYSAIYGSATRKEISEKQARIFAEELKRRMS